MQFPETLIPVDDAVRIEEAGLCELFVTPPDVDEDDIVHLPWVQDVEGHGLILYVHRGKRDWVSSSVSKTPFAYLQKALNASVDFTYLESVFVFRGVDGYPLSEVELKYVASALNEKLKDTSVSSRLVAYTAPEIKDDTVRTLLDDAVLDILDAFIFLGLDVTPKSTDDSVHVDEVRSGVTEVKANGLLFTVATKLKDENDREAGLESLSIRVSDSVKKIVSFSTEL